MSGNDSSARMGAGFWVVQLIIVAALVVVAFLLGRAHARDSLGDLTGPHVEDHQPSLEGAKKLLEGAEYKKEWSRADEDTFATRLARLSLKTRVAFAGQLANLINTGKVKIKPEPSGSEPPICPCVPGLCPSPSPAPAPAPGKPAPAGQ